MPAHGNLEIAIASIANGDIQSAVKAKTEQICIKEPL